MQPNQLLLPAPAQPLMLSTWSVTTTVATWREYPAEVQKRTAFAARMLPYKDTPRSRWEAARVVAPMKEIA